MYVRNILLSVGVLALLVGIALAVVWLQQGSGSQQAQGTAATRESVLVAASDLRIGTLLRAEDVAWKPLASVSIPPAATRMAPGAERTYFGAVVRRDFKAGEPLVPGGVVMPGARGFLAAVLAPGMRAISLGVDAASSAAGLVQPGDYVDVILAQSRTNAPESRSVVGETVLQNVRVIAVDQTFSTDDKAVSGGPAIGTADSRIPKTVTLEVDEDSAKRLLVAAQLGKVTLAIRALSGAYAAPVRQTEDTLPVWSGDVSAASGRSNGASRSRPSAAGKTQVTIIRGSNAGGQ